MNDFLAHVLVVDDDEGIRSLVKKYLNENKYLVTTAENAEDALEKVKIIKFFGELNNWINTFFYTNYVNLFIKNFYLNSRI